jgi:hypothetical protein
VEDLREDLLEVLEEQTASGEDQGSQGLVEVEEWEPELRKKVEAEDFLAPHKLLSKKLTGLDMTGC